MTEATGSALATTSAAPLQLRGVEKVAALLITLGATAAARILKLLPEDARDAVAQELVLTQTVSPQVRDQVMAETFEKMFTQMNDLMGGSQYAYDLFIEAFGPTKGMDLLEKLHASMVRPKFDFLANYQSDSIAQLLLEEHPQTIAIVLAQLEAKQAAMVLAFLEPAQQVEVARRIALTGETTPDAIDLIEEQIRHKATSEVQETKKVGGYSSLAQVLNQVDRTTEKEIMGRLLEQDAETHDRVRDLMFTFEDIMDLDDRTIQTILREIDVRELTVALRDPRIPSDLKERFFKNMTVRAAEQVREDMSIGATPQKKNVEAAQTNIVQKIRALEEKGEIQINRGADDGFG